MINLPEKAIIEIRAGNVKEAKRILGIPFSVKGKVIHGNHLGRTIGFPTANIQPDEDTLVLPGNGVYAVNVFVNGKSLQGMTNIGIRPTLDLLQLSIEVNIFDFNEDIYGQSISVEFFDRIRDERKFPGLDALKEQISKDKETALSLLGVR